MSYWRASNVRKRLVYWWREGHLCRHQRLEDDPPHWEREEPGTSWGWWSTGTWQHRTCLRCWIEQRRHCTGRSWRERRRARKRCFHHDHGGNPANTRPAVSWIKQELIDTGKRKRFWCDPHQGGCERMWFS